MEKWIGALAFAVALLLASSASPRDLHVSAAVGETVKVLSEIHHARDCTLLETVITIDEKPIHGTVSVRDAMVKLTHPDWSLECLNHPGQGKAVYYTRTSPGIDHFKYSSSAVGNQTALRNVTVE
jgi:hypothetical protein